MTDAQRIEFAMQAGYRAPRILNGQVVAYFPYIYTVAIVVGVTETGEYTHRYCYSEFQDALHAFLQWDGVGHPSGPWIVLKGGPQDGLQGPGSPHYKGEET